MAVRHAVPVGQVRKRSDNSCSLAFLVDYDKPNIEKTGLTDIEVETPSGSGFRLHAKWLFYFEAVVERKEKRHPCETTRP